MNKGKIFVTIIIVMLMATPVAHADFWDWVTNVFRGAPTEATVSELGGGGEPATPPIEVSKGGGSGGVPTPTTGGTGGGGGGLPIQPSPAPTTGGAGGGGGRQQVLPTTEEIIGLLEDLAEETKPGAAPTTEETKPGQLASSWDLRLHDVFRLNAGETQIFKNVDGSRIKVTLHEIVGGIPLPPPEETPAPINNPTLPLPGEEETPAPEPGKRVGAADMTYRRYDKNGDIIDEQRLILLPRDIGFVVEVLKTGGNKALLVIPIPEPIGG